MHASPDTRLIRRLPLALVALAAACALLVVVLPAPSAMAASPMPTCSGFEDVPVTMADGSTRCVENTCEAIMGAQGQADSCTTETSRVDSSVPAAGSGIDGVAPVPAPVAASVATADEDSGGASLPSTATVVWSLVGLGTAAALLAAFLFVRGRAARSERDERPGTPTPA